MKLKSVCVPRLFDDFSGRYRRQVDTLEPEQRLDPPADMMMMKKKKKKMKKKNKRPKESSFTSLSERSQYKPLEEDDSQQQKLKEEKKAKKKEKYKKYKKNMGKALRYSWKCLMLGLQNFTVGYSTPLSAASTIIPDFHPGGAWG